MKKNLYTNFILLTANKSKYFSLNHNFHLRMLSCYRYHHKIGICDDRALYLELP